MFQREARKGPMLTGLGMMELIFHAAVRSVRKNHGNPIIGLLLNIFQTVMLVAVFFLLFQLLGMRGMAIRGDYLLYVMSGIFMFMTHIKALGAVAGCEGPTSAMMKHAPMNTFVAIASAALASLYTQLLSAIVVLYIYHAAFSPISFHNLPGVLGMLLLSWSSGAALGTLLLALKPWQPDAVGIITQLYQRANMIASGKMFVANTMPTSKLAFFDWNPLFHTIDQGRGFTFLNYHPHYSNWEYPLKVTLVVFVIGLMAENFTRKHASISWGAKR
ncbi:ABC transporter permease [Pseudorhodobacter turbinis]|uniref:ABC transporter permease n=2 Tax=Pseudorhodobacter turbinis TaxID=2500533 RepID=A0A4P8EI12_9RHOB|nr:ABC transporter permease [Pseudorhodobacter turbinis]QCO56587.1 ABC transporter permease [Pseudorhodobacter turbinis]